MKKLFTTIALVSIAIFTLSANNYKLDDQAVNSLFNEASETSISSLELLNSNAFDMNAVTVGADSDVVTVLIACVIDAVGLGAFGIHRYILGTKGSMWAVYTFTVCGIFGIVPTVDFFVLLIDGAIQGNSSKYIDNESFFMWL